MKKFLALMLVLVFVVAGCVQQPAVEEDNLCAKIETFGVSPENECRKFPTTCLPSGWAKVETCESFTETVEDTFTEPEPEENKEIDLCENVVCSEKCEGTTLWTDGYCLGGTCKYTPQKFSERCGFDPRDLKLEAKMVYCEYYAKSERMETFLSIRNIGGRATKPSAEIWMKGDKIKSSVFQIQNNAVEPFRFFFENKKWTDTRLEFNEKGDKFVVLKDLALDDFNGMSWKYIFCEDFTGACTEEIGTVILDVNSDGCEVFKDL